MRGGAVTRSATPAANTGVATDGPADAISAKTIDTRFTGWASATARTSHDHDADASAS